MKNYAFWFFSIKVLRFIHLFSNIFKQITLILLVLIALCSCNKELDDVPDYQPGRLIELSFDVYSIGLVYHKYEYANDKITDSYYYSSPKVFISKYHFNKNQLEKVHYSFKNTIKEYFDKDSTSYNYSESMVIETNYNEGENQKEIYNLKNGKIVSCSWKLNGTEKFIDYYYEWSGDNLIRCEQKFWINTRQTPIIKEYVFEYTDIENPFYSNNIPRLMKEFNNPYNHYDELTDLIPKCSKNFPLKLIIRDSLYEGRTLVKSYTFNCKTFHNNSRPYEIKVIDGTGIYSGAEIDYFLKYEKL